jgi:hypothetical protein
MATSLRLEGQMEQSTYEATHAFMMMMNYGSVKDSEGKYDSETKELAAQAWKIEFEKFKEASQRGIRINKAIGRQKRHFLLRWF